MIGHCMRRPEHFELVKWTGDNEEEIRILCEDDYTLTDGKLTVKVYGTDTEVTEGMYVGRWTEIAGKELVFHVQVFTEAELENEFEESSLEEFRKEITENA